LKEQYPHSNAALHISKQISSKTTSEPPQKADISSSLILTIGALFQNSSTSVTIAMERPAVFHKDRLSDPDRIYLDISNAKLSDEVKNRTIPVGDGILKQIRTAQSRVDMVRIVLDCSDAGDYSIAEFRDPFRIVINLRRRSGELPQQSKVKPNATQVATTSKSPEKTPPPAITPSNDPQKPDVPPKESEKKALPSSADGIKAVESSAQPTAVAKAPATVAETPKAAIPTSQGDRTLTRILGLKVGRIVIDPGHGGHDQGTVGPGGFAEKDLVISVALSLQKMLQEKLGAEVILTRKDDTFIPLEERTQIANQYKADLFISIHANSSGIRSISGVETYYLNFAKTDAEREIAARENATTVSNVGELEDLIMKIARADKAAESKELASTIQKKLFSGARQLSPSTKNRGVRSAPFVVLIGANMPSVLAEIAFISNPKDEKALKREANREYLVKALYSGIEAYIKTLGSDPILSKQVQKQ
jgi:N-acetylmuramoyl-L-alanine amidase